MKRRRGRGTSNAPFSYRTVAKRKDLPTKRLEAVQAPARRTTEGRTPDDLEPAIEFPSG